MAFVSHVNAATTPTSAPATTPRSFVMPAWMQQQLDALNAPRPTSFGRFGATPAPTNTPGAYGGGYTPGGGGLLGGISQGNSQGNSPASFPPGMDPGNFGPSPAIPQGGSTTPFNTANSVASQMQSATGRNFLANLGKYGQAGVNGFLSTPQSFSVADFNRVAASDPTMAAQMQAAGGQAYRNAIMQGNGWNNFQNNSFINANGSGALPGFGGYRG